MHAMAALITEDFHASLWTDQEVGIAMGRDVLLVPVRVPTVPYGFMGRHQALPGDLARPQQLAAALVDVFVRRPQTSVVMHEALTNALEHSHSFSESKVLIEKIQTATGFTKEQLARLEAAIRNNDQVGNYYYVGRLRRFLEAVQT